MTQIRKRPGGEAGATNTTTNCKTNPNRSSPQDRGGAAALDTRDTIPGANTKPVPDTVTAALAKAREKNTEVTEAGADVGTELDEVKAEVEIDYASATYLDGELRGLARTVATNVARFKELIDRAREQRVHELLGFSSWTTYVADVIGKEMDQLDVDTRRDLVALLAGEGMSQRAIADAVGVNHATVSRDQATIKAEQVLHDATPDARPNTSVVDAITKITGRDGKTYPKRKEQRVPAPATIGRLMRKLRDLNRIADECLAIAEEFDFDSDEESYEQYNAVDNLAGDLQMTVERIIEAIEGQ